jgi:hypothetical protein
MLCISNQLPDSQKTSHEVTLTSYCLISHNQLYQHGGRATAEETLAPLSLESWSDVSWQFLEKYANFVYVK